MSRKPCRDTLDDDLQKGEYVEDLRVFADKCICMFFKNKTDSSGRRIKEHDILTEFANKTVLYTQFDDRCFDFLHEVCLPLIPVNSMYNELAMPWTVHSLIGLLGDLKKIEVPKEFQPGLLLLYFKFCYGVVIPPPPLL
jgi:hypothetical protein